MSKATVNINGKEYNLKFTVGFWKKIQDQYQVTQANIEQKLRDNFGEIAGAIVYWGIYYGLSERVAIGDMPVKLCEIEDQLERSVMDAIEQAIINGMTVAEKEMLNIAKRQREAKIKEITEEINNDTDNSKKKE